MLNHSLIFFFTSKLVLHYPCIYHTALQGMYLQEVGECEYDRAKGEKVGVIDMNKINKMNIYIYRIITIFLHETYLQEAGEYGCKRAKGD